MRMAARVLLVFVVIGLLTACASRAPSSIADEGPGLLLGLLHGFIAPVALVVHLFESDVAVYAVPNSGGWYDLGFLWGSSAFFIGAFVAK